MTEIFKVKTGIAQELMKGVFEFTDVPYNLRNLSKCNRSRMASKRHLQNYGPKLWGKIPTGMRENILKNLKSELKVGFPKSVFARYVNCPLNM